MSHIRVIGGPCNQGWFEGLLCDVSIIVGSTVRVFEGTMTEFAIIAFYTIIILVEISTSQSIACPIFVAMAKITPFVWWITNRILARPLPTLITVRHARVTLMHASMLLLPTFPSSFVALAHKKPSMFIQINLLKLCFRYILSLTEKLSSIVFAFPDSPVWKGKGSLAMFSMFFVFSFVSLSIGPSTDSITMSQIKSETSLVALSV